MPQVQWEWKFGPGFIISALNMLVMLGGIIVFIENVQLNVQAVKEQATDLRVAVTALTIAQTQQAIDGATTKAKIEIILPKVEKIEDLLTRQPR